MSIDPKSNEYARLQKSWSVGRSPAMEKGARNRVKRAMELVGKADLPSTSVCVLGFQHGFELLEYKERGVDVLGVDVSPIFCDDARAVGFDDVLCCPMENLPEPPRQFDGAHASHSLEHVTDLPKAIANIQRWVTHWCFVSVPIEKTNPPKDKAHFSPIYHVNDFVKLWLPWVPILTETTPSNYEALMVPPE